MKKNFEIWLVRVDESGKETPYEQIGGASNYELAKELKKAAQESGYNAEIFEDARAI